MGLALGKIFISIGSLQCNEYLTGSGAQLVLARSTTTTVKKAVLHMARYPGKKSIRRSTKSPVLDHAANRSIFCIDHKDRSIFCIDPKDRSIFCIEHKAQRSIDFAHQKKKYRLLCCINANDRAIFPKEASIDFLYRAQRLIYFISSLVPRPGYFSVGVAWGRGYVKS